MGQPYQSSCQRKRMDSISAYDVQNVIEGNEIEKILCTSNDQTHYCVNQKSVQLGN